MKRIIRWVLPLGLLALLFAFSISQVSAQNSSPSQVVTPDVHGPPWYDPAWNYRRPVVITNTGLTLPWYQVLLDLDAGNFNFSRANSDGSDLRFTHSDGTTLLSYWIESWDSTNHQAFVWVKVPNLPTGDTTIYLYYNNPAATPASDGATTFDGFDENWSQFSKLKINRFEQPEGQQLPNLVDNPFTWITMGITPTVSTGILSLPEGSGIKSTNTYQYGAVGVAMGMRANFGQGSGHEWGGFVNGYGGQRTIIGDLSVDADDLYLQNYRIGPDYNLIARVSGQNWHGSFHIYEVRWETYLTTADVDHGRSSATSTTLQVPNIALPVTLYSYPGSAASLQVDWAYARQYRDPEPSFSIRPEQARVDVEISATDTPDPLPTGEELTYLLTITNNSLITAPGVTVTDTLPASVQLSDFDASQGHCSGTAEVVCDLGSLGASSSASVTIIVVPEQDGIITNTAVVDSPGYEFDAGDNFSQQQTLVDSEPPTLAWMQPVHNRDIYLTYGGPIMFVVTAEDNDQVARVEFYQYDINNQQIYIGTAYSSPFEILFDTDTLEPNRFVPIEAFAFDRAGNRSPVWPENLRQIIYIMHIVRIPFYLPFISK